MKAKKSMASKLFTGLVMVLCISFLYGLYIDFVPSKIAFRYGWIASIVAGLCCFPH